MKNRMKKIKRKIRKIFVNLLFFWYLTGNSVKGAPLPGADGFSPKYISPKRDTYSRHAIHFGTHLQEHTNNANIPRPNRALYDRRLPEFDCIIKDLQIQRKYKHAPNFGVTGNLNRENIELFKNKIIKHMKDPSTVVKKGTYKKNIEVIHYFNAGTDLNVMIREDNGTFLSGWLLTDKQRNSLINTGAMY